MFILRNRSGKLDEAIEYVKTFFQRYPPSSIKQVHPKPALRSTRTVLVGERPLVRLTSTVDMTDNTVPPLLTFSDLEVLHHKLVSAERVDEIGFVKYVCKAYEGALRIRRDGTIKSI